MAHGPVGIKTRGWGLRASLWGAFLAGAACFGLAAFSGEVQRAWQAYLVNLVYWLGACMGSVTLVAVMNMTHAKWGRSLKRLAEAPVVALPFIWASLLVLYVGHHELYPWAREPVHGKELWLSAGFLFARNALVLGCMVAVALVMVYHSVKGDMEAMADPGVDLQRRFRPQVILSPVLGLLYGVGMSLLSWDLIMSLDPHWVSTLFGAYYFIGSLYAATALVAFLAAILHDREEFRGQVGSPQFHDLGKLLLAFCLVTGDFFYSQFLVIWYGNIPEETKYVILRVRAAPWATLAWTVLVVSFALPFLALLSRRLKLRPRALGALGGIVLVGMWLERMLLVAPSVWSGPSLPLGWVEAGVTLGFVGLVGLPVRWFLSWAPWLPVGDPMFQGQLGGGGVCHEAARKGQRLEAQQGVGHG